MGGLCRKLFKWDLVHHQQEPLDYSDGFLYFKNKSSGYFFNFFAYKATKNKNI